MGLEELGWSSETSSSRAGELSLAFSTHVGNVFQFPDTAVMGTRGMCLVRTFLFKNQISSSWKFGGKNCECLISSRIETTICCGFIYHVKDSFNSPKFKLHAEQKVPESVFVAVPKDMANISYQTCQSRISYLQKE